jgi:catechol 2,3-dioxygenase-like lactoylglutathione lyase family enzyme
MGIAGRLNIVTLGVSDVAASERFYTALGWSVAVADGDDFRLFDLDGGYLAIFPAAALAEDAGLKGAAAPEGFRGVSCAINLESVEAVDAAFAHVAEIGGRIVKPPEQVFWGGYSGYFADPDGHLWEIAYGPGWPIGEDGRPALPR